MNADTYNNYLELKRDLTLHTTSISRRVRDMFTVKTASRYKTGYRSGKFIDHKSLYQLALGETKVFKKKFMEQSTDYAITVLIDHSGSMADAKSNKDGKYCSKIQEAQKATIVLGELLSKLNIPFEILGFSTRGSQDCSVGEVANMAFRRESLLHLIYKTFDDGYDAEIKSRIGQMESFSCNWDGEAILWAFDRLKQHKAKEKIMLVLSDGMPSGGDQNATFTKKVCQSVGRKIKLIGIGFMNGAVKNFYKNHIVVNEIDELPNEFCRIMFQVLSRPIAG